MRLAIVGSRNYRDLQRVEDFVNRLAPETVVVSGGASGVDRRAERAARARGLTVDIFEADWNGAGRRAGIERNERMLATVDAVAAFWDGESRGTAHAILCACRLRKFVRVCGNHGEKPLDQAKDRARRVMADRPKKRHEDVAYDPAWEKDVVSSHRGAMLRRWGRGRVR